MKVLERLARYRSFEQSRKKQVYYVVYPGSEKLDLGDRKAVTITRNRDTAIKDVKKYGEFGEVVVLDKKGLLQIIEEW